MAIKSGNFSALGKVAGYKQVEHAAGGKPAPIPKPSKSLQDKAAVNVFNAPDVVTHSTPVTIGKLSEEKKDGIKMRGTGAATKGTMARGPMA
jgi:hypothetical protein